MLQTVTYGVSKVASQTNSIENQAEVLLEAWAPWQRDDTHLGLPRISATEAANSGGVMRGSARAPSDMPEEVALTDRAVAALGQRHRSILRRYIHLRYERGLPLEGIGVALRLNRNAVKTLRDRALRAVYRHRLSIV